MMVGITCVCRRVSKQIAGLEIQKTRLSSTGVKLSSGSEVSADDDEVLQVDVAVAI